jgi:hypothetical protein
LKEFDNITELLKQIMRYVGNGYKYISVSKIPENKFYKKHKIIEKLTKKYELNLTTWQRQYKRRKGIANHIGLLFRDTIIILKTEGSSNINDNSFKNVLNTPISFKYISVILYKDERGKLTYKLNKEQIKTIKANLGLFIKNRNGTSFHKELKKLYNLHRVINYRGFMLQVKTILNFIKEEQKKHGTKFQVMKFF